VKASALFISAHFLLQGGRSSDFFFQWLFPKSVWSVGHTRSGSESRGKGQRSVLLSAKEGVPRPAPVRKEPGN